MRMGMGRLLYPFRVCLCLGRNMRKQHELSSHFTERRQKNPKKLYKCLTGRRGRPSKCSTEQQELSFPWPWAVNYLLISGDFTSKSSGQSAAARRRSLRLHIHPLLRHCAAMIWFRRIREEEQHSDVSASVEQWNVSLRKPEFSNNLKAENKFWCLSNLYLVDRCLSHVVDKLKILAKIAKLDAAESAMASFSGLTEQRSQFTQLSNWLKGFYCKQKNGPLPVFNVFISLSLLYSCSFFFISLGGFQYSCFLCCHAFFYLNASTSRTYFMVSGGLRFSLLNLRGPAIHCGAVCHISIRLRRSAVEECVGQTVSDPAWPLREQCTER